MGGSVAYSDVPEGFSVKSSPASYGDIPEGFTVKTAPESSQTDPIRSAYRGVANTLYQGINDVGSAVGKAASYVVPDSIKKTLSEDIAMSPIGAAGKALGKVADAEMSDINDLSQYNQDLKPDLKAFGKNVKAAENIPIVKPVAELSMGLGGKALTGVRGAVNAGSDAMATKVPVTQPNAYIIKTLKKAGHSDEDIVDIVNRAKKQGMSIGEASNNPDLLGMERKISGMNNPGGEIVRDFVKNRVDPNNNVSMPFQLKSISDPLVKEVDRASKEIGATVASAPKTPLNMNKVLSSLASEKRPAGSSVTNTLERIDKLAEFAKEEGNTFEAWHRVKQEIYAIGKEATDPNAIAKLDKKTVTDYYNKVNDVLTGRSGELPKELVDTGAKYARANANFQQNLSGRTIADVLSKMPEGGTPASSLKYLYKQLAGNKELRDELFAGMPESNREGMMKLLEAIRDSGRSGANDIVKSMQQGSPSFPLTTSQVIHKAYDRIVDMITRKDYDSLGKALTSPEAEQIAKKLGYVKPLPPKKPILRLTYQPERDIFVGNDKEAIIGNEKIMAAAKDVRDRMEKLGYGPGVLRAQDLNVIRDMEQKYGQSELRKFMIEHKNEPIMGRAWEVPQTEYNQATVDKMLGRDAMSLLEKLDKETQDSLHAELRTIWDSHKTTLAEMALDSRRAIKELSEAKGQPITVKFGHNNFGDKLSDAVNTGTPLNSVIPQVRD